MTPNRGQISALDSDCNLDHERSKFAIGKLDYISDANRAERSIHQATCVFRPHSLSTGS